jgi:hypothetical protein
MAVSDLTKQVMADLKRSRVISLASAPTRRLADARALGGAILNGVSAAASTVSDLAEWATSW